MTIFERQQEILNFLRQKHFSTIKELSQVVYSSESSVRRDIKTLEQNGYVTQIYGGVVLSDYKNSVVPLSIRDTANSTVKDALAEEASHHITDGATIIIDGSTTARRIIKHINKFRRLKIITNNHQIFNEYEGEHEIYCTGGRFLKKSNIFVGHLAEEFVKNISADILFFSSQSISEEGEITDISEEETHLRKIMLKRARKKIFICDSSKIGLEKTFRLCSKDDVDVIICDKPLPWEK